MLIHKTFTTEKERIEIIAEMQLKGYSQVSTTGYFIGEEHLLFDNGVEVRDLAAEIDELKEEVGKLKVK